MLYNFFLKENLKEFKTKSCQQLMQILWSMASIIAKQIMCLKNFNFHICYYNQLLITGTAYEEIIPKPPRSVF